MNTAQTRTSHAATLIPVPTILRFRNFRIVIWPNDHLPIQVHVFGPGTEATFILYCRTGSVTVRDNLGIARKDLSALRIFIRDNLRVLCAAWEEFHGNRNAGS